MEMQIILLLLGFVHSVNAQQSVLSSLGHGHVHGRRGHDDDDFQFGILGTNRFVDIGCRDPTGFCRDRVSRIRLGGTQGSITSYEDILRSGIRQCGANRLQGGCQYVPEYCSFTPVREGLAGGLCKECPIDMCAVEQPGWDLRRRQRRSRVTNYLCQQFGFCGAFGSGREVGRSYWSRMGSRWWQPGERWSESGWQRIGHAQSGAIGTLGHGHVHGGRRGRDDDFQFGILGSNRFVDIGCRDPTGFCRDRVSRIRLGGTQGSITSYEDILRSGIRECGANRIRGGCQYVPEYCSFTPVREGLAGGLCKECPIDMCEAEQPGWDPQRRQRRSRVTNYLCQQFGFCGDFGSGREVGRSYWSRMGSRWWQPGERWSESGWRRIGHAQSGAIGGTLGHGHVQGHSRPYDYEFGILGSNRFVDIGCRDPTGFCRDRVSRFRIGGTQGSITSYEDILRSGIRQCGANRIQGGCQYVPEYCSFTPVREGLAGGLCKECPIDMCEAEQSGWDPQRRQWRSRVTNYLCQQFGICRVFGSGRDVGRSYWSRMGSRWWRTGERWSGSGWQRVGHGHTDIGHSFRSPYEDNLEWGILGSDAFVDLGCTTGFCSDRFRGIRLGTHGSISSYEDIIRGGLRQCRAARFCTMQHIPEYCRYTPVRPGRSGGLCKECPIDICEAEQSGWRPERRQWRQRISTHICEHYGICDTFGRGRDWGRDRWSRMGRRWWRSGEYWSGDRWQRGGRRGGRRGGGWRGGRRGWRGRGSGWRGRGNGWRRGGRWREGGVERMGLRGGMLSGMGGLDIGSTGLRGLVGGSLGRGTGRLGAMGRVGATDLLGMTGRGLRGGIAGTRGGREGYFGRRNG